MLTSNTRIISLRFHSFVSILVPAPFHLSLSPVAFFLSSPYPVSLVSVLHQSRCNCRHIEDARIRLECSEDSYYTDFWKKRPEKPAAASLAVSTTRDRAASIGRTGGPRCFQSPWLRNFFARFSVFSSLSERGVGLIKLINVKITELVQYRNLC